MLDGRTDGRCALLPCAARGRHHRGGSAALPLRAHRARRRVPAVVDRLR